VDDKSLSARVPKRADQLVEGDRIPGESLPYQFAKGPAEVIFVCDATTLGDSEEWTFLAYRHEDGYHDSTTVLSSALFQAIPTQPADPTGLSYSRADDGETTQPIAARVPPHFGAVVSEDGLIEIDDHMQRELPCGIETPHVRHPLKHLYGTCPGVIEIDPPWNPQTRFFEPGRVPELVGDDVPSMAREMHIPHCPARYDSSEPCIPGCRESAEQRGVSPASAD
jgi:hypothetical protein